MRKPTATSSGGKHDKSSDAQGLQETSVETVEERDPLVNLRRLEEDRPGFHWRGTRSLKTLVHGTKDSNDKNKGDGDGGTSIHISLQVEGGVGKELDLCAPVAIFPGIGMCPLLRSEYPVIRPGSMPSAEITSYKPTSQD